MKHLKTLFMGCQEDKTYKPSLENSHVLRLCSKNCWSYANVLDNLAATCHLTYSMKDFISEPLKVSILLPYVYYRKNGDKCTNLDVIEFFIKKLLPPPNGIIFSIFEVTMQKDYVTPGILANIWPFVDKWDPKDHISVQIPEPNLSKNKLDPLLKDWKKLKPILDEYKTHNIKYVDYSMDVSDVYDIILGSKLHISYTGASYWIAGAAKVPMIAFGPEADKKYIKEFDFSHNPLSVYKTQYNIHSPYNFMRNYDMDTNEPNSSYHHLIYNMEQINSTTKDTIDALANFKSSDRDMWIV